jgi:hypothetical protein
MEDSWRRLAERLLEKTGKISEALIMRKLKVSYKMAKKICEAANESRANGELVNGNIH